MGTDNLHHIRKAKVIGRRAGKKKGYSLVLIVCEDSKSTPAYLQAICDSLRLSAAKVEICGKECGSAPLNVLEYAIKKREEKKTEYEKIYCVIDRDKHQKFQEALRLAEAKNIEMIISIPCFEYWLLLHFEKTDKPFKAATGSDCETVITCLKKYLSDYEKSGKYLKNNYKKTLKPKEEVAIKNAEICENNWKVEKAKLEQQNPFTQFHKLITYLNDLNNQKNSSVL